MKVVSAQQMQAMDRTAIETIGIPGIVLMENAARGCVSVLRQQFLHLKELPVGIVAGRGNNGGDGLAIARYLHESGVAVTVFLLAQKEQVSGDAAVNLKLLEKLGLDILQIPTEQALVQVRKRFKAPRLWIDAILGTGLNSAVRGRYKTVIEMLNQSGHPILGVDIPSGINADNGQIQGTAIQAHTTVTFGHPKTGHLQYPGRHRSGRLWVVDIGIPDSVSQQIPSQLSLLTPRAVSVMLPRRAPDDHKGRTGHVLVIGGSPGKTGAPVMTANAAVRAGAGLVTLAIADHLNSRIEAQILEPMSVPLPAVESGHLGLSALDKIRVLAADKRCLALGPGLDTHPDTVKLVQKLVQTLALPLVIDADGLNCLAAIPKPFSGVQAPVIITPHPGEMARLMKSTPAAVQADRINHARTYATQNKIWVVLKGAGSVIADPRGRVWINATGNPGMASGGMGDVLTGMIAGFLAQGVKPARAACAGVYLHGLAADHLADNQAPWGYTAGDLLQTIPIVLGETLNHSARGNRSFLQTLY